jgi:adenylate cyclase
MSEQSFVARENELKRLHEFLDQSLLGQSNVCFVAGEAGAGKSALVNEFVRRVEAVHETLVIALGECNSHAGLGDPFLPFREIIAQLTGAGTLKVAPQNAKRLTSFARLSARTVVEIAPDLINTLVPGVGLLASALKFGAEKAGWLEKLEKKAAALPATLDENLIFQQIANLFAALAKEQPLLLVLDDLQWADETSIALLFHLSRTLKADRILIIGTYRSNDIALGRGSERHPLESILNEIKRYRGDVVIDLNEIDSTSRRIFVDAFIDSEPNRLEESFRTALFAHTEGYPLFTVELLRNLQERGELVWDNGWTQPKVIDWSAVPARVEGVIEERIGRLDDDMRAVLDIASIEGAHFTVQVVARVRETTESDLLKNLSDSLEKRHRLIQESGEEKVGKMLLWRYSFAHALFQKYLYDDLSRGERRLLHGVVAHILEEFYGEQADTIAPQLARHYEEAGEDERAAYYHKRAGEQAAALYGNAEAIAHFTRALELTPDEDSTGCYDLYRARHDIYNLQGAREAQLVDIQAMERLADALEDNYKRAQTFLRHSAYSAATNHNLAAITAAEKAIIGAQSINALEIEAEARLQMGKVYFSEDKIAEAQLQVEQSLTLSRSIPARRLEAENLSVLGRLMISQHKHDLAQVYLEDALGKVRECSDRLSESHILGNLWRLRDEVNDAAGAEFFAREALRVAHEIGYRAGEANGLKYLAGVVSLQGAYTEAQTFFAEAREIKRQIGDTAGELECLAWLAALLSRQGNYAAAATSLDEAFGLLRDLDNQVFECWLLGIAAMFNNTEQLYEAGYTQASASLVIAEALASPRLEQFARGELAHGLAGLGRLDEAGESYRRVLTILREAKYVGAVIEPLNGLAQIALAKGELSAALAHVEEILPVLQTQMHVIKNEVDEPIRVFLTCYQVLKAANDLRAEQILQTGYELLQAQSLKISDEVMRRSYLENVPYNRELVSTWKAQHTQ